MVFPTPTFFFSGHMNEAKLKVACHVTMTSKALASVLKDSLASQLSFVMLGKDQSEWTKFGDLKNKSTTHKGKEVFEDFDHLVFFFAGERFFSVTVGRFSTRRSSLRTHVGS